MKIICITEFVERNPLSWELTYGKTYKIEPKPKWANNDSDTYFIRCDKGYVSAYNKASFVTLENWREIQLGKIL